LNGLGERSLKTRESPAVEDASARRNARPFREDAQENEPRSVQRTAWVSNPCARVAPMTRASESCRGGESRPPSPCDGKLRNANTQSANDGSFARSFDPRAPKSLQWDSRSFRPSSTSSAPLKRVGGKRSRRSDTGRTRLADTTCSSPTPHHASERGARRGKRLVTMEGDRGLRRQCGRVLETMLLTIQMLKAPQVCSMRYPWVP
jgi:hypothetical protein